MIVSSNSMKKGANLEGNLPKTFHEDFVAYNRCSGTQNWRYKLDFIVVLDIPYLKGETVMKMG
jgi:hypothetical protein